MFFVYSPPKTTQQVMGHHAFVTHSHFHRWDTTKEITHCTVLSPDTTSVLQQHTQTHKFIPLIHTSIQVNLPADELNAKVLHFYLQRFFFTTVRFLLVSPPQNNSKVFPWLLQEQISFSFYLNPSTFSKIYISTTSTIFQIPNAEPLLLFIQSIYSCIHSFP